VCQVLRRYDRMCRYGNMVLGLKKVSFEICVIPLQQITQEWGVEVGMKIAKQLRLAVLSPG
jgi:hypothetical protein